MSEYCSSQNIQVWPSKFDDVFEKNIQDIPDPLLEVKRVEPGKTGLSNSTNNCFINCVLQPIMHSPQLAPLLHTKALRNYINTSNIRGTRGSLTGCLSALANLYWCCKYPVLNVEPILTIFATEIREDFGGETENDAHEFLWHLLNKLGEDTNRGLYEINSNYSKRSLNDLENATIILHGNTYMNEQRRYSSSIITDLFTLVSCSITTCTNCQQKTVGFEQQRIAIIVIITFHFGNFI
uniref:ubiquitinyl hydrolase 1 n=1 Tax=Meloidogyne incognita TaxID=6306 RepID=A0A914LNQ7_MELIC